MNANRNIVVNSGATATFDTDALASATTIPSVIGGAGGIATAGTGTLVLTAANTYAGATTVPANTVVIGVDNALPNTTSVTLGSTTAGTMGGLDLSSNSQFIKGLSVVTMAAAATPVNTIVIGSGNGSP